MNWTLKTMQAINDLTPDIKGKAFDVDWFLLRQRFELMEGVLTKLTEGHWDARTENSWERQNRRQWGPFDTEKLAEEAAKAEAETHNDTASYGEAVFECDYSSNELRELALKVLND